jgi:hypothetical protein
MAGSVASASFTKATTLTLPDGSFVTINTSSDVSRTPPEDRPPPAYTAIPDGSVNMEDLASTFAEEAGVQGVVGLQRFATQ